MMVMSDCTVLAYTIGLYCTHSSSLNPDSCMILNCFTMVLLPLSPAPASRSLTSLLACRPSFRSCLFICLFISLASASPVSLSNMQPITEDYFWEQQPRSPDTVNNIPSRFTKPFNF
ncbi:unnamed protein product, partial [Meganyctiphanes norvegica]